MALAGSMSAGISAMKAHMDALTTVGNNVANVNTYGYKPGRITFKESIYSTQAAGSNGTETLGGTNPRQTGYGCSVGTIDLDMSTVNMESTGNARDAGIQGDGFFLLGDKNGVGLGPYTGLMLSKVGDFRVDANGYITDGYGNIVYGFATCNATKDAAGTVTKEGDAGPSGEAISTQLVPLRLPLAATTADDAAGIEVGDAIFPGVDDATGKNTYGNFADGCSTSKISICIFPGVDDATGKNTYGNFAGTAPISYNSLSIGADGKITCNNDKTGDPVVVGYIALATVTNPSGLTHTEGPYYKAMEGSGDMSVFAPNGSLAGQYLNNAKKGDANATMKTMLGEGGPALLPGFLEASGTDLAAEFSNMIIYQRGYQANTRIVTVTDTMLEELVNMKR